MRNHSKIKRLKLILTIWLILLSTLFFSTVIVFGAYQTDTKGGMYTVEYIPIDEIAYTASAINIKLRNTQNLKTITFDYDNGTNYETVKSTGKPYVEFTNYTGTTPISSYVVETETATDVYFLCEEDIIAPTNCSNMFSSLTSVTNITFNNFNTSKVESMAYMFSNCSSLIGGSIYFDLLNFNTQNVTTMAGMFYDCSKIQYIFWNDQLFNTTKVTTMVSMFEDCSSLKDLYFSGFKTSNVTDMSYMFNGCASLLGDLDVSSFDTSKVTTMVSMFEGCSKITGISLSNFNTSKVTDMTFMFLDCYSLTSLNLSNFNTSIVKSMSSMFDGCSSLSSLNLSSFNTSKVTNMLRMFEDCSSLTYLDLRNFDTAAVEYFNWMFYNCSKLEKIRVNNGTNWKSDKVRDGGASMFYGCSVLKGDRGCTIKNNQRININYAKDDVVISPGLFSDSDD